MGKLHSQDWANINRYANENELLKVSFNDEERIVFMGDSITEGWKNLYPEFFKDKSYINRGIGGQTTPQMLVRFRADVINLKPSIVVIFAGTNDIAENTGPTTLDAIAGNIYSMAELAMSNNIKVVLCSVLPAYDYPWRTGLQPAEKIIKLNKMIRDYASRHNIFFVDFHTTMKDDQHGLNPTFTTDGVHLNKLGYEVISGLLSEILSKR